MEPEYTTQLQHILERMTVGVVMLDCTTLNVLYANSYLVSFCPDPWRTQGLAGNSVAEILPPAIYALAQPLFKQVCANGQKAILCEVPYEGFLETRGRTYWNISLELSPMPVDQEGQRFLLVMLEDVTDSVRARRQLEAIHHISAAIAGQSPLSDVLERILLAMQELVGSQRCAVLLIGSEEDEAAAERAFQELGEMGEPLAVSVQATPVVTVVAQRGLYEGARDWHPPVSQRLLLGKVLHKRRSMAVPDTSTDPQIDYPLLDDHGRPVRPGSVVCVPILETLPEGAPGTILGTIEIYHRRSRGLPNEEVDLLERFAPQAGLAIQNARLFQRTKHLARVASQQAHQLENVMRAIPDGVIIYDADWHLLQFNAAAGTLLGWSGAEVGLHIQEALAHCKARFLQGAPSISSLIVNLGQDAEAGQRADEFEMLGANGKNYTMRRSKAPIQDERGHIFAYVVVYHDVSEQAAARKQIEAEVKARTAELAQRNKDLQDAQDELRQQTDRLQLLLERLPAGVVLIGLESQQVNLMNNQAKQLLARMGARVPPREDAISLTEQALPDAVGLRLEEVLREVTVYNAAGAVMPYEERPLYQALHQREASEAECWLVQPDGQTLNLLVKAIPLSSVDGTAVNVVLVWQDITPIKMLERARENFFTTLAHELKTPLANIRAHLSALQVHDMSWSPSEQLDFLRTADEQVERMVGMINYFLDASRVEAGALRPEMEPILLPEMFEDLQERLEALIASSQRRLVISAAPTLPAVCADYELVMVVLINLLSNAFRYAPVGDAVRLEGVLKEENGQAQGVTIRVSDRGPGIPLEQQAALFTRFSTFAETRRPAADRPGQPAGGAQEQRRDGTRWSPATGLGLYISRGIIEAHGSVLELTSNPDKGTTFAFTLALAGSVKADFVS